MLTGRKKSLTTGLICVFSALMLVMMLISCISAGQSKKTTSQRQVSGFNKISLFSVGDIYIEQGDEESLTIEADEDIIKGIITEVRGKELTINMRTGLINLPFLRIGGIPFFRTGSAGPINFYIKVKDLNSIDFLGSGDISIKELKADDFSINLIGSGDMDIELQAKETSITISGSGDIRLKGSTQKQTININGSGGYIADDFLSKDCRININGSGDALINASHVLEININGAGDVRYIGDPDITQNVFGTGNIEKAK